MLKPQKLYHFLIVTIRLNLNVKIVCYKKYHHTLLLEILEVSNLIKGSSTTIGPPIIYLRKYVWKLKNIQLVDRVTRNYLSYTCHFYNSLVAIHR